MREPSADHFIRYSKLQVASVVLVTIGVILTTLSSVQSKNRSPPKLSTAVHTDDDTSIEATTVSYGRYAMGISILTFALILSGALGISQDRTFERYGRGNWEEAMFYLHALALPLFGFTWPDLVAQFRTANTGPQLSFSPLSHQPTHPNSNPATPLPLPLPLPVPLPYLPIRPPTLRIPSFYVPLFLNVLTQLFCVSGVNRLTARANSLTVSLILVVRKAASLGISVLLLGGSRGNNVCLWAGAAAVLVGSFGYTLGSRRAVSKTKTKTREEKKKKEE